MEFRGIRTGSEAANPATGHREHCISANARFRRGIMYARRRGEHGSAILESFLSMILLGMILFGILQLFQLVLTDMITDYSAFRGARSAAVGFDDTLAIREALVKAAPVSGNLILPEPGNYSGWSVDTEKTFLQEYMRGDIRMEYADWVGEDRFHLNYHCPDYGKPIIEGTLCPICSFSRRGHKTNHYVSASAQGFDTMRFHFEFVNYPLNIPLHEWLTGRDAINIAGDAELTNHSSAFLDPQ